MIGLPKIGLGTASLGNLFTPVSNETGQDLIQAAQDARIDWFDTAPYYGHGLSERRIGQGLIKCINRPMISSKVGRVLRPLAFDEISPDHGFAAPDPFVPDFDYSSAGVLDALKGSRERLGQDYFDIVFVHDLGQRTHGLAHEERLKQALLGAFPTLARLKSEGAIGAIGLGVNEFEIVDELMDYVDLDVVLLAGRHTLLDQRAMVSGFFQRCANKGVVVALAGVFNSGILASTDLSLSTFDYAPVDPSILAKTERLRSICARHDVPLGAAALQFATMNTLSDSVLIGPRSREELAQLVSWNQLSIPSQMWRDLADTGVAGIVDAH